MTTATVPAGTYRCGRWRLARLARSSETISPMTRSLSVSGAKVANAAKQFSIRNPSA